MAACSGCGRARMQWHCGEHTARDACPGFADVSTMQADVWPKVRVGEAGKWSAFVDETTGK
jgi:hypothetical protein